MKLSDVPVKRLRAMLLATTKAVGADTAEVRILLRELERRRQARKGVRDDR